MTFHRPPVLALLLCLAAALPATAQQDVAAPPPTVTVAEAQQEDIALTIIASGGLIAVEDVMVYARISGAEITDLLADVGDTVEQGQPLAQLNAETYQAQKRQAEANLAIAEAAIAQAEGNLRSAEAASRQAELALDRTKQLRARGDSAQAVLDQDTATADSAAAAVETARAAITSAEAQKAQAEAALQIAELNLAWTTVKAPVDGVVVARNANLGDLSSGAAPMFQLIQDGEIEVSADVIETDLVHLSEGDPASVSIAGLGTRPGTVRRVSPLVDAATRLGNIRVSLPDQSNLRVGLFAQADITADRRNAVTVPVSAILTGDDGEYVQKVVNGTVERQQVTVGLVADGRREILTGLEPGDTVLVRAGAFFQTGDTVTPEPVQPEATEEASR
ncbi:efflux RND transporter periplasmic adaptor subunit [Oceaniglobus roseus]|uniref:efflux RND transporter periplasmic adaptor subunit n=1 Tax=Oceaniglobus roseus TaxID=1737570 RepID=UPI000C7F3618|nr:efflux RND transporter periplasmic adaptor subunit [Kandeliimicrobium roseum]